jgi:hypothetical protein
MRTLLLATVLMSVPAVLMSVPACTAASDVPADTGQSVAELAVSQCLDLVGTFCVAANQCGFDEAAGTCLDYYGAMCDSNQTIVTPSTLQSARVDLSVYECAPNEAWITFADPSGQAILDAMLVWDAR